MNIVEIKGSVSDDGQVSLNKSSHHDFSYPATKAALTRLRDELTRIIEQGDEKCPFREHSGNTPDYWNEWICIFPGKLGLSWKQGHYCSFKSKAEAEIQAAKNCNVVAVPAALFERYKEYERRMVVAERVLQQCQSSRLFLSVAHPNFGSARIARSLSDLSFEVRSSDPLSSGSSGDTDPTVP